MPTKVAQTKDNPRAAFRQPVWIPAAAICLGLMLAGGTQAYSAPQHVRAASPAGIVLVPGTVVVEPPISNAVATALNEAEPLLEGAAYFAITDLRAEQGSALASVIGLNQLHDGSAWSIEDGVWVGLVLLKQISSDTWIGAVQGTDEFYPLILETPDSFLAPEAKQALASRATASVADYGTFIFPWRSGYSMFYGQSGVHDNGFSSIVSGWKAVDMLSDGDASQGHAPNRVLAAAPAVITYKCKDANNVAVRAGSFFYTHLIDNANLVSGAYFVQGAELGQMRVGPFGKTGSGCGWASQPEGWFHVHWGFPDGDLTVERWTLSMATQNWTDGTLTVAPGGGWIKAEGVAHVFDDLPVTGKEWMVPWINAFYFAGITAGCGTDPLIYCPENPVNRAEMAVFVLRAMHGSTYSPPAASHYFSDLPVSGKEWMEPWVDEYYREGLTSGCGADPLVFCPENNVTRAEMAVFLLRATHIADWQPSGSTGVFTDVPVTGKEWMQPWIEEYYRAGITSGCNQNPLQYCPEASTTRAEMAVFIDRAFHLYP